MNFWKKMLGNKIYWKASYSEKIKVLAENDNIKLYGVKFYTRGDGRNIREELQDLKILPGAEEKHIDELIL